MISKVYNQFIISVIPSLTCNYTISSGDSEKDPPVYIPNTEVKLFIVENTWLVTAREDRKLLDYHESRRKSLLFCFIHYFC